jgi:tetratricopeptide (TPR) repeat protein
VTALRDAAAAALAVLALAGWSPFQAEERNVREGNERLLARDPAEALRRYDAAEAAVGPRAEIDYDRGNALHRLGRHAEARDAYRRALDRGAGALSSRALQNLGNTLDALGDRDGALQAFTEALRKDPGNDDARFDLEVLLRRQPAGAGGSAGPQWPPQPAPGAGDAWRPEPRPGVGDGEAAARPGPDGDPGAERPRPRGAGAPRPDAERAGRDGSAAGAVATDAAERGDGDATEARGAPLSRQDAERLLDALRARERNMPLGGRERKERRRAMDVEKDW